MVSLGIAQSPHGLLGAGVGKVRNTDDCRRLHSSHIWRVISERGGHRKIDVARLYRWYCCVVVESGLASECWLEEMLRVRATLCRAWVSADCGLYLSGPSLERLR